MHFTSVVMLQDIKMSPAQIFCLCHCCLGSTPVCVIGLWTKVIFVCNLVIILGSFKHWMLCLMSELSTGGASVSELLSTVSSLALAKTDVSY